MSAHIVITGPQRSGKSTLLEIFTRLGMDTGFTVEEIESGKNEFLEHDHWGEHYHRALAYFIKHAKLASGLQDRVRVFGWKIDHVFILLRAKEYAVEATLNLNRGGSHESIERRYYNRLGKILYQCETNNWSYSIVKYEELTKKWGKALEAIDGWEHLDGADVYFTEQHWKRAWKETMERRKS